MLFRSLPPVISLFCCGWPENLCVPRGTRVIYIFENYSLDPELRELRRGTDLVPIEPQVFDLLEYLIRNRHRVVSKDDMIAKVWKGRIVSDSALSSRITDVRQAVGDSGENQRLIRTVARKGIRFVGEVRENQNAYDIGTASGTPPDVASSPAVPLPDRPSIAVLPFEAMAGDAGFESFADGLTEDIITGLSRIKAFWVIAPNTMLTYKGRAIDVRTLGKELGVQYVVNGSVRKDEDRLRMTAQLIEAETGHHIWAAKFDRASVGLFDLQDDLAQ